VIDLVNARSFKLSAVMEFFTARKDLLSAEPALASGTTSSSPSLAPIARAHPAPLQKTSA